MLSSGKVVVFDGLLQYLAKNMALLVQKFWGGIFLLSKSLSGYFKTKKRKEKKFRWPLSSGGDGGVRP